MSRIEPVDPRVRLAISNWPANAPRGAVTGFCAEHGISRKTFYVLRARCVSDGPAAVLEPRSRRPRSSPTRVADDAKRQAIAVRASLERSGLDHGPISVHDKMAAMGLPAPSPAALARIFREAGVARAEPRKRPRASYRRFVYPAPNACWQLDATAYVLTGGRECVIFQLLDDHSRFAIASHVAEGETAEGALAVVRKGIAVHGVPQRLLSDNGAALNPSRRGVIGQLVAYVTALGVEAITGKPGHPTTQGKNERFHQTLFRWLHMQPLAETIEHLQAQVDEFDAVYNTQRPHQGLPGRITPAQAWTATPLAPPPRPAPVPHEASAPVPAEEHVPLLEPVSVIAPSQPGSRPRPGTHGQREVTLPANGLIYLRKTRLYLGRSRAGHTFHLAWDSAGIVISTQNGTVFGEHAWSPGTTYANLSNPATT